MRSRLQSEDIGVRLQIVSAMLDYLTRTIVIARTRSVFIGAFIGLKMEKFFFFSFSFFSSGELKGKFGSSSGTGLRARQFGHSRRVSVRRAPGKFGTSFMTVPEIAELSTPQV